MSLSSKPEHVLRVKPKTPHGTTWQCRRKQNFHVPVIHTRWTGRTAGGRKGEKEGDLSKETKTQQCTRSLKYQYSLEMQNHFSESSHQAFSSPQEKGAHPIFLHKLSSSILEASEISQLHSFHDYFLIICCINSLALAVPPYRAPSFTAICQTAATVWVLFLQ